MEEEKHMHVDESKQQRIKLAMEETEVFLYPETEKTKAKQLADRRKSYGLSLASVLKENYLGEFKDAQCLGENIGKLVLQYFHLRSFNCPFG